MTTTEEQPILENSEQQSAPEVNSDTADISEPEIQEDEAVKKSNTISEIEIPEKFKNKDGSANLNSIIKSYKELEPLINEKANWTKEKELLNKEKEDLLSKIETFENKKPFQLDEKDKISINVGMYEKNIEKSSDKLKAKELILDMKKNKNFSDEKLKELENLFPVNVVKEVSLEAEKSRQNMLKFHLENEHKNEMKKSEEYLKTVVEKNFEDLKNPAIFKVFNDAFLTFGSNLDADWFFSKIKDLKQAFIFEYEKSQTLDKEKSSAISTADKLAPNSSTTGGTPLSERNALDLTPQELDMMIEDYFNRN